MRVLQGNLTSIADILDDVVAALVLVAAHIEGAGIRVVNTNANIDSYIKVGAGNSNDSFGLTEGASVSSVGVPAQVLTSALMSNVVVRTSFATALFSIEPSADATVGHYAEEAVSYVHVNEAGRSFVGFESLSTSTSSILEVTGGRVATTRGMGRRSL